MLLKIQLDEETARRLTAAAVTELRPVHFEAEAILRRALGTMPADLIPAPAIFQPKSGKTSGNPCPEGE